MPLLVAPALSAGSLGAQEQPHLPVRPGLALRPWCDEDAPAVRVAFDCPAIQRWHVRRLDDDEAREWTAQWVDRWPLHRLALEHSTANTASCRVATRAGFRAEGVLRGSVRHADGWHDMHLHALLATDSVSPR
ncbi:GNAT family protein [Micromonospora sp. NPDC005413]|uniref:GNAT family N-acetyltransferase n=1 Tax=Micromonospora sp. NPDC005413 TaxID=3154563 RepID=UPI0033A9C749